MKFSMPLFKKVFTEMMVIAGEIDNDEWHDMLIDCFDYHKGRVSDSDKPRERDLIKDFILFHFKFFNSEDHWMYLKPRFKQLADKVH